jgi:hypothetical protein
MARVLQRGWLPGGPGAEANAPNGWAPGGSPSGSGPSAALALRTHHTLQRFVTLAALRQVPLLPSRCVRT